LRYSGYFFRNFEWTVEDINSTDCAVIKNFRGLAA